MKSILVPCDFSIPASQAFKFAMEIAQASEGEVYLLNVIEMPVLHNFIFTPVGSYDLPISIAPISLPVSNQK